MKDDISFVRVNGANDRDIVIEYQIPSYPSLLIFKKGSRNALAMYPPG